MEAGARAALHELKRPQGAEPLQLPREKRLESLQTSVCPRTLKPETWVLQDHDVEAICRVVGPGLSMRPLPAMLQLALFLISSCNFKLGTAKCFRGGTPEGCPWDWIPR